MNFLIVSGGNTDRQFANEYVKSGQYDVIVAADSGMNSLYDIGIVPDIIVGDFDSADEKVLEYYKSMEDIEWVVLVPEKDDTDTESAIRYSIKKGACSITILGGTGSRLDHVMGNICLLGIGIEENISIQLVDANNRIRLINRGIEISKESQFGKYVSLIPFAGDVEKLTLEGMKYPLFEYHMGGFNSLGISNEIVDDVARIKFEKGYLLVIESRDN